MTKLDDLRRFAADCQAQSGREPFAVHIAYQTLKDLMAVADAAKDVASRIHPLAFPPLRKALRRLEE